MSDWLGILVIAVLFVAVVVLAVVLFIHWQEQEHNQKRPSEDFPTATPIESPVVKPRIVLRRPAQNGNFKRRLLAETKFKRKQIAPPPKEKLKPREVKIDFDEVHKVTGIPIRVCPCEMCKEMRANVGS